MVEPQPSSALSFLLIPQFWLQTMLSATVPSPTSVAKVEPGRVNLNTISEANVFQAALSNELSPNLRTQPGSVPGSVWSILYELDAVMTHSLVICRMGSTQPHFPTEFAGLLKPVTEAGMVQIQEIGILYRMMPCIRLSCPA